MKISYKWLNTFFTQEISVRRLTDILIAIGFEVESVVPYKNIKSNLTNCVAGEIVGIKVHPETDHLKILSVNIGVDMPLSIVCGAVNIEVGKKVVIALSGTDLYTYNGKHISIKESIIQGVMSVGMACSEKELGVGDNTDGLLILSEDIPVGTKMDAYFDVYEDMILDLSITPNRTDSMSYWGIAKEVIAYVNYHEQKNHQIVLPNFEGIIPPTLCPVKVTVDNPERCMRYVGVAVKNVTVTLSPMWLQNRLRAIGVRPVNNIVDITNYILYAYGNPVHAYDMDKIEGGQIRVTFPKEPVSMLFLDNKEREVATDDLLIADGAGNGLCLAGIMGGKYSAISASTKNVFFEIAHFSALTIRKSAARYDLRTESALRFEKGTDFSVCMELMKVLLALLSDLVPSAVIAGNFVDIFTVNPEKKHLLIPYSLIMEISGKYYKREEIRKILLYLDFEILRESEDVFEIIIPHRKCDIESVYDVVEEIMRIDGLDNIPVAETFTQNIFQLRENTFYHWKQKSLDMLSMLGLNEILTNPIINRENYTDDMKNGMIQLANPLSAEHNAMRTHTFFSGLESIAFNYNRKNKNLRFFELGKKYIFSNGIYREEEILSLWFYGMQNQTVWNAPAKQLDFYALKSIVQMLFKKWGFVGYEEKTLTTPEYLYPAYTYLKNGEIIVQMGYLKNTYTEVWNLENPVLFAQIKMASVYKNVKDMKPLYMEVGKYPVVTRDLALVTDKNLPFRAIEKALTDLHLKELQNIVLFDVYENESVGKDKKSFAFTLYFVSSEKTFTDSEIENLMQKIMHTLKLKCQAYIRQ